MNKSATYWIIYGFIVIALAGCLPPDQNAGNSSDLKVHTNYFEGLQASETTNKPVFLTFSAYASLCCKTAYFREWILNKEFKSKLEEDYTVIILYTDDKTKLDPSEFYISKYTNKLIRTIGQKNSDMQIELFNSNAQPFSIILDKNGKALKDPLLYRGTNHINSLIEYLE